MATPISDAKIANNGGEWWFSSQFYLDMTLFKNIAVENA